MVNTLVNEALPLVGREWSRPSHPMVWSVERHQCSVHSRPLLPPFAGRACQEGKHLHVVPFRLFVPYMGPPPSLPALDPVRGVNGCFWRGLGRRMLASIHSHFVMVSRGLKCNRFFTLLHRTVSRVMDETKSYCKKKGGHVWRQTPLFVWAWKLNSSVTKTIGYYAKKCNKYLKLYWNQKKLKTQV